MAKDDNGLDLARLEEAKAAAATLATFMTSILRSPKLGGFKPDI
ncbi:hypothetical protein [Bradyrhizobium sp. AUGA SZCCT0160]|nr:hypothetical protein [Bradyrhizobium sp. AUGA SZCCT0160]